MADDANLRDFERIKGIIRDQIALEKYQRRSGFDYDEIQFSRVDAYHHIVHVVMGSDIDVLTRFPFKNAKGGGRCSLPRLAASCYGFIHPALEKRPGRMKYLLLHTNGIADIIETPKALSRAALEKIVGGVVVHVSMPEEAGLCAVFNGLQYIDHPPPMPVNPWLTSIKGDVVIATYKSRRFLGVSDLHIRRLAARQPPGCIFRPSPVSRPSVH